MLAQKLCYDSAVFVVLPHANRKGLGPSHNEESVHRRDDRSGGVLNECKYGDVLRVIENNGAAYAVAVTVQIFRGGVDYDIGSQLEWTLEVRAHKGIVYDEPQSAATGNFGNCTYVHKRHHRIRGSFDEYHPGFGS